MTVIGSAACPACAAAAMGGHGRSRRFRAGGGRRRCRRDSPGRSRRRGPWRTRRRSPPRGPGRSRRRGRARGPRGRRGRGTGRIPGRRGAGLAGCHRSTPGSRGCRSARWPPVLPAGAGLGFGCGRLCGRAAARCRSRATARVDGGLGGGALPLPGGGGPGLGVGPLAGSFLGGRARWRARAAARCRLRKSVRTVQVWVSGLAYGLPHVEQVRLACGAIRVRPGLRRRSIRATQVWAARVGVPLAAPPAAEHAHRHGAAPAVA